ncbi:hypothetical protein EVAR_36806_1 [Eumeta japonica]|uniref:Uncharacterized protein n=1 Tax=Eumeta variegata TaxID=151549 RepID=A0A4C1WWD4_EUMVA|nr:hypothetical protein EVAR_36806_1 [Eumeta japonica]
MGLLEPSARKNSLSNPGLGETAARGLRVGVSVCFCSKPDSLCSAGRSRRPPLTKGPSARPDDEWELSEGNRS